MRRTALLHHFPVIPNQFESHYDWLVELELQINPHSRSIPTWRVFTRVDLLSPGEKCVGQLIQPHRALYFNLEKSQQLSQLRGIVQPVLKGKIEAINRLNEQINLKINWQHSEQCLEIDLATNIIQCVN